MLKTVKCFDIIPGITKFKLSFHPWAGVIDRFSRDVFRIKLQFS